MRTDAIQMRTTPYSAASGVKYFRFRNRHWQHADTNDDNGRLRQVGPVYETRRDLLADHTDYLVRAGWLREEELVAIQAKVPA